MTIGDLLLNSRFTVSARFRIYLYLGLDVGDGDQVVLQYQSDPDAGDLPPDLTRKEITSVNVTDDGWLEIEYVDEDLF